jgi:hypothetical protein
MPFSLRNASNTFLRKMDRTSCSSVSPSKITSRLPAGVTFHLSSRACPGYQCRKSIFGVTSIYFLVHWVNAAGVTPLPQYLSAVVEFPQLSTVKELQTFLSMVNFYRRFLPVADILRPHTDSLSGDKEGRRPAGVVCHHA